MFVGTIEFTSRSSVRQRVLASFAIMLVDHARRTFDEVQGITIVERGKLVLFGIEGKVLLRFKKLDPRGRSANIPTEQALSYAYQRPFAEPGFRRATNIDIGYELDSLQQEMVRILLSCPTGKRIAWTITLLDNVGELQLDLPAAPTPKVEPF